MKLNLDTFILGQDIETKQYRILGGLQQCSQEFLQTRLYPTFRELIDLHNLLQDIIQGMKEIQGYIPHELRKVDLKRGRLVYDKKIKDSEIEQFAELIVWALPQIEHVIDEGIEIYNFVSKNMQIVQVGLTPNYRDEGYLFMSDPRSMILYLIRYKMTVFTASKERYRCVKTTQIKTLKLGKIVLSPESIKLRLIREFPDLPNPATYLCETDLCFPFQETLLPIGRRKLMAQVQGYTK